MQLVNPSGRKVGIDPATINVDELLAKGFRLPEYRQYFNPDSRRILVSRPIGGIGDMVCLEPAVRGLKDRFPEHQIEVQGPPGYAPLVPSADVFIEDEVNPGDYYLLLDMDCPADQHESAHNYRPIKNRTEVFCEVAGVEPSQPRLDTSVVNEVDRLGVDEWLPHNNIESPFVVIQLHSSTKIKDFPYSIRLARLIASIVGVHVVLVGTQSPPQIIDDHLHFAHHLTIGQLVYLSSKSNAIVAPDSALFHIGGALGVPTIGLFGPTNGLLTCKFYELTTVFQSKCPSGAPPCGMYHKNFHGICKGHSTPGECMIRFGAKENMSRILRLIMEAIENARYSNVLARRGQLQ